MFATFHIPEIRIYVGADDKSQFHWKHLFFLDGKKNDDAT